MWQKIKQKVMGSDGNCKYLPAVLKSMCVYYLRERIGLFSLAAKSWINYF